VGDGVLWTGIKAPSPPTRGSFQLAHQGPWQTPLATNRFFSFWCAQSRACLCCYVSTRQAIMKHNNNNIIIIIIIIMIIIMMIRQFIRCRNMSMKSLQGRRIHAVHAMNAEQRQTAADPWPKPTDLSHWPACRQL